jgi:hypothetical protein
MRQKRLNYEGSVLREIFLGQILFKKFIRVLALLSKKWYDLY